MNRHLIDRGLPLLIIAACLTCFGGCASTQSPDLHSEPRACTLVGTGSEPAALKLLFDEHRQPLVVVGGHVYTCSCACPDQKRRLGGSVEARQGSGVSEQRRLGGDTEARKISGATEQRRLGGGTEARKVSGASEQRRQGGVSGGPASGGPACSVGSGCGCYRSSGNEPVQIFDGTRLYRDDEQCEK